MEKQIYMTPKQPLWVIASEEYQKYVMNKFGIVHFYQCKTGMELRYTIPDGCVDMVFRCDPIHPYAEICGTVLAPKALSMQSNTCYFGVRFLPGYNPVLGYTDIMRELVDQRVPFTSLVRDDRMLEGICETTDFRRQIAVFMHSYMKIYRRVCPMEHSNLLVLHSANLLISSAGSITVEQLADETGYTTRYINKCFQGETGLSPKQFAKIVRFQAAVSALNNMNEQTLTDIAVELGYFDQSHFVRDFKAYTGLTPKKYQTILKNDKFCQKLKIIL